MDIPTEQSTKELSASRQKAIEVAKLLYSHRHVRDVLLFGSLVHADVGHDIDLIIVSDHDRGSQFITLIELLLPGFYRKGVSAQKLLRQEYAAEVLEERFDDLLIRARELAGVDLDILVFPPDWRKNLKVLQKSLHAEPAFIENIARDAVSLLAVKV